VVVTVKARTSGLDTKHEDAAQDLGATPLTSFWIVTFPLIFMIGVIYVIVALVRERRHS
jgi:ABC-type spermidine/putrescine transport system permease subunit II